MELLSRLRLLCWLTNRQLRFVMLLDAQVYLASNPETAMFVSEINNDGTLLCRWFVESTGKLHVHAFHKRLLITSRKDIIPVSTSNIKVGDVFRMKIGSSGCDVVVNEIIDDKKVICYWLSKDSKELQISEIEISFLSKIRFPVFGNDPRLRMAWG